MCREPKEGMTETVSHTFKRELNPDDDRKVLHALSRVINESTYERTNGSADNSVYVNHCLLVVHSGRLSLV